MLKKNFFVNWLFLLSGFTPIWMLFINNSVFLTVSDYKEFSLIFIIQIAILACVHLISFAFNIATRLFPAN